MDLHPVYPVRDDEELKKSFSRTFFLDKKTCVQGCSTYFTGFTTNVVYSQVLNISTSKFMEPVTLF